jgi:hypothetical protein
MIQGDLRQKPKGQSNRERTECRIEANIRQLNATELLDCRQRRVDACQQVRANNVCSKRGHQYDNFRVGTSVLTAVTCGSGGSGLGVWGAGPRKKP